MLYTKIDRPTTYISYSVVNSYNFAPISNVLYLLLINFVCAVSNSLPHSSYLTIDMPFCIWPHIACFTIKSLGFWFCEFLMKKANSCGFVKLPTPIWLWRMINMKLLANHFQRNDLWFYKIFRGKKELYKTKYFSGVIFKFCWSKIRRILIDSFV